jgi:hypothetical protein
MGTVVFDYAGWIARYPEFATLPQATAQALFNEAGLYCDNTACSPITDDSVGGQRSMLLWMVTAHIAALNFGVGGESASPLVGRVNSASEGSVSVAAQMDVAPGSAQGFAQTKYGAAFWQATAQFRTMFYCPGPAPVSNPFSLGGFGG